MQNGGLDDGSFTVETGAYLGFDGYATTTNLSPSSQVAGAGTVEMGNNVTVNVAGTYDVSGAFQVNGASAHFTAPITLLGNVSLTSGTLDFSTGAAVATPALTMTGGNLTGSDALTVSGLTTWTGGTMSGTGSTLANNGLQLGVPAGPSTFETLDGRTFSNAGAGFWAGSNGLQEINGSTFDNLSGATLTIQGQVTWATDGTSHIINNGTIIYGVGVAPVTIVDPTTLGSGITDVASGTLELQGSGTVLQSFTVEAGATLILDGSFTFTNGASVSGAGAVELIGGNTDFAADAFYNLTGPTFISSGTIAFDDSASLGDLALGGGNLSGVGTVAVHGLLTWTGGTMSGSGVTQALGGMQLGLPGGSDFESLNARTLSNSGVAVWAPGNTLAQANASAFLNLGGATVSLQGNDSWRSDGTATLVNAGTLQQNVGNARSELQVLLKDSGPVLVGSGTLQIDGGIATGHFNVSAGANLVFAGGVDFDSTAVVDGAGAVTFSGGETFFTTGAAYNVSGATYVSGGLVAFQLGSSVAPLGALTISGGTVDFSTGGPAITTPTLTEWGGTLTGIDTLAVNGLTTWTGGYMTGAGETNALGGLQLGALGAANIEYLYTRTLNNATVATWAQGDSVYQYDGSTFLNPSGSTVNLQGNNYWYARSAPPRIVPTGARSSKMWATPAARSWSTSRTAAPCCWVRALCKSTAARSPTTWASAAAGANRGSSPAAWTSTPQP